MLWKLCLMSLAVMFDILEEGKFPPLVGWLEEN